MLGVSTENISAENNLCYTHVSNQDDGMSSVLLFYPTPSSTPVRQQGQETLQIFHHSIGHIMKAAIKCGNIKRENDWRQNPERWR